MREQQIELMKEYLQEIDTSVNTGNREETLFKIIKKEKRTIPEIINNILTITLIIIVLYAVIDGRYISNQVKIVETCQGQPIKAYNDKTKQPIPLNEVIKWQNNS